MNDVTRNTFIFSPRIQGLLIKEGDALFPAGKIYCVGRNYEEHAKEMGSTADRDKPFFFSKPTQATTHKEDIPYPSQTTTLHHEVELVVLLGSTCSNIDPVDAAQHIFGYAVGIDLTKRDLQELAKQAGKPWDLSKGFDDAAPISAILQKKGQLIDSGVIRLDVNGETRQSDDLSNMIWKVDEVISSLSQLSLIHI